jgi:RNA polymerase sigma-70 factor, ECF subfamily
VSAGNVQNGENALQEAFLSAFKNIHQFRGHAELSSWLDAMAINSARVQLPRLSTRTFLSLEEPSEEEETGGLSRHGGDGVPC